MQNSEVKKGLLIMRENPDTYPIDWSKYVVSRIEEDGTNWYFKKSRGMLCDGRQPPGAKVGIVIQAMDREGVTWEKLRGWKPEILSNTDDYITVADFEHRCQSVREAQEKPSVDPAPIVAKFLELGFRVYLEGDSVRFTHRSEIERLLERVTPCQ